MHYTGQHVNVTFIVIETCLVFVLHFASLCFQKYYIYIHLLYIVSFILFIIDMF